MFDGIRYEGMREERPNGEAGASSAGRITRETSWKNSCAHTGIQPSDCMYRQTCDTIWVRCAEGVDYQNRAVELVDSIYDMSRPWRRFEDVPAWVSFAYPRT